MKFCNLASGSKGNASLVISDATAILIDDGISLRDLKSRCNNIGFDYTKISAIFISHEHIDHIKGANSLSKTLNIPIYIQPQSLSYAKRKFGEFFNAIESDFLYPIIIGDIKIEAFRVSHDAIYTQGFFISCQDKNIIMATDLGYVTKSIYERFKNADYLYIESNYDKLMLQNGSYPASIKKRILGRNGHLSNEDCAKIVADLYKNYNKKDFMLAHISENNNSQQALIETFNEVLKEINMSFSDLNIEIALQSSPSRMIEL